MVEKKDPAVRMGFLFGELQKDCLSHSEFQKECAYWLLEDEPWNNLKPADITKDNSEPSEIFMKPNDYSAWENMKKEDREICDKNYYEKHPSIMWHVERVSHAWHTNTGRIDNLIFLKGFLLEDDKEAHEKYRYKVKEYLTMLNKINHMRRMCDFEEFKKGVINRLEPPKEENTEEFSGRIV